MLLELQVAMPGVRCLPNSGLHFLAQLMDDRLGALCVIETTRCFDQCGDPKGRSWSGRIQESVSYVRPAT